MADFGKPATSDAYTSVLSEIRQNVSDVALMLDGTTDTSIPVGAKRYNSSTNKWERWDGSVWSTLAVHTPIDAHIGTTGPGTIHETRLPGEIVMYGGGSAPSGWLLCDGAAVSRTTYAALFGIIGTSYGAGNGSTTFNVPDLRQRFPLGKAASGTGNALGGTGGAIDHTHSVPNHSHSIAAHTHDMGNHTHTGGAHSHPLNDHFHSLPAHYHDTQGLGADINITSSGSHLHDIDSRASGVAGSGNQLLQANNLGSATVNTKNNSTPNHTHPHSAFSGRVGNVNSTISGDSTYSSNFVNGGPGSTQSAGAVTTSVPSTNTTSSTSLTTNTDGGSTSGSNNPPYVVVNYLIHT